LTDEDVLTFVDAMSFCVKRYFQQMNTYFKQNNLTVAQGQVLQILHRRGTLSLIEVSKALDAKPSSMSGLIDRLVKANLVTRNRDDADRRVIQIALSDKGKKIFSDIPFSQVQYYRTYLEKFSEEEFCQLSDNLQKLVRILEEG
jgi:DNA-binding MarR family transcriptional regulator